MRVIGWVKENPGKAALFGGVAILALWFVFFRGSASSGSVTVAGQSGPSDAEVASATQLSLASMQLGAQAGQQQFALAQLQQQQAGDITLANLGAQTQVALQGNELTYRQTVELANLSTQEAIATRTLDAQTAWATIQSNSIIQTQMIAASQSIQLGQIQSQTNLGIAAITGDVQKTLAGYQKDVAIAQSHYQAQATIAGYSAKSEGNWLSMITSVAGIAASAFISDVRFKRDIVYVGMVNGFRVYNFRYVFGTKRYQGVLAHEIERIVPDAVKTTLGIKSVNYGMIGVDFYAIENNAVTA